jgi:hypothetical protein
VDIYRLFKQGALVLQLAISVSLVSNHALHLLHPAQLASDELPTALTPGSCLVVRQNLAAGFNHIRS